MKKFLWFLGVFLAGALVATTILAWHVPALASMAHRGEWVEITYDNGHLQGFGVLQRGWVCSAGVPVASEGQRNRMACVYIPRPWFALRIFGRPRVPSLVIRGVDLLYQPTPFQGVRVERSYDPRTSQPYQTDIRYIDPATIEIALNRL